MCGDPYWLIRELSSYLQQYGQAAGSCSAETLFSSTCNEFVYSCVWHSIVYFTVFFSLYFVSYQFYNLQVLALVFGLCISCLCWQLHKA